MKRLYRMGFLVVCLFGTVIVSAQSPLPVPVQQHLPQRPLVFKSLPDKWECRLGDLQQLFTGKKTERVALSAPTASLLDGQVMEKVQTAPGVESINIRLTNYPGAILNLSSTTHPDHTVTMRGLIVNPKAADIIVLTEKDGHYYFEKKARQFFMVE